MDVNFLSAFCIVFLTLISQMLTFSLPLFQPRLGRYRENSRFRTFTFSKKYVPTKKRNSMPDQMGVSTHPTNKRVVRLCSRKQNFFLQVTPDGVVNGTHNASSKYTNLEQESIDVSVVRLRGLVTKRYIAMDRSGKIYSTLIANKECIFHTYHEENYYHSFWSYAYPKKGTAPWLLSVRRNGRMKRGMKTRFGERSTQFVSLTQN